MANKINDKTRITEFNLTNSKTIDSFDRAIADLQNNPKLKNSISAQNEIERLQQTRTNLKKCLLQKYNESKTMGASGVGDDTFNSVGEKIAYQNSLLDLMSNNFKPMSLEKINDLQSIYFRRGKEDNLNIKNYTQTQRNVFDKASNFFTGKTGFNLMSIVKTTISVCSLWALGYTGGFSAIGVAMSSLWTLCPPLAICAGVVGLVGLTALVSKVFGPEFKKIAAYREFRKTLANTRDKVAVEDFDPEKERKKIEEDKAENANKEDLKDLAINFSKRVKSVDDLIKLKTQLGNTTASFTVPKTTNTTTINFDMIIKEPANAPKIKNMFEADAKKFVFDTDKTNINALRDKYKDFLNEKDMDEVTNSLGISKAEDFSQSFDDVQNSIDPKFNNKFNDFKNKYNNVVTTIVKGDKEKAIREIKRLETVSKTVGQKTSKSIVQPQPKNNGTSNTSKIEHLSDEDAVKLSTLCENMVQMLKELYMQIENGKNKFTNVDEAKKAIAEQHGLDAKELDDLLK